MVGVSREQNCVGGGRRLSRNIDRREVGGVLQDVMMFVAGGGRKSARSEGNVCVRSLLKDPSTDRVRLGRRHKVIPHPPQLAEHQPHTTELESSTHNINDASQA